MKLRLIPLGRLYDSEQQARDAVAGLDKRELSDDNVTVITRDATSDDSDRALAERIVATHTASRVPDNHASVYAANLTGARALVLVTAPFGQGLQVERALDGASPVTGVRVPPPEKQPIGPTPFSDFFGIPVLTQGHTRFAGWFGGLTKRGHIFPSVMGLGLKSDNPTPLSSALGLKVLSKQRESRTHSFGMPLLLDNPMPLSSSAIGRGVGSLFGVKATQATEDGQDGHLPLLIDNPGLFSSSRIGRTVASWLGVGARDGDEGEGEGKSKGLPLLIDNPTPLSSWLGLPVLTRKR